MSTTWKSSCVGSSEFRFLDEDRKLVRLAPDLVLVEECHNWIPTGRRRSFQGANAERDALVFASAPDPGWDA